MALSRRKSSLINNTRLLIASRNVDGGLHSPYEAEILIEDFRMRKVAVCALQEMWTGEYNYKSKSGKGMLIGMEPKGEVGNHLKYTMGFFVAEEWIPYLKTVESVSNRIAVASFIVS